jgi:hypothetical protein
LAHPEPVPSCDPDIMSGDIELTLTLNATSMAGAIARTRHGPQAGTS